MFPIKNQRERVGMLKSLLMKKYEQRLESNLSSWTKRKCPICNIEKTPSYHIEVCDDCVDTLNKVEPKAWKKLGDTLYRKGDSRRGRLIKRIFKHRRHGLLLFIDPLPMGVPKKKGGKHKAYVKETSNRSKSSR